MWPVARFAGKQEAVQFMIEAGEEVGGLGVGAAVEAAVAARVGGRVTALVHRTEYIFKTFFGCKSSPISRNVRSSVS